MTTTLRQISATTLLFTLMGWMGCGDSSSSSSATCVEGQSCPDAGVGEDAGTQGDGSSSDTSDMEQVVSWTTFEERPCPEDSYLTYGNFGGPFVLNWCAGCHSSSLGVGQRADAPPGVDFDNPELIRMWAPRIWARTADDNLGMPPVGGPGAEERFLLGEWLACGAP